ncbi:hypothetical protein GGR58DRAFT_506903 [Xylaria digitata]|nr:hypothetical protein GGR58DRAFT_506903 [Xylaria digitata]
MTSIMRKPSPTKRPASVDKKEDPSDVGSTKHLVAHRTPLPTLPPPAPIPNDDHAKRLAAARRHATRRKKLLEINADQIDPDQSPSLQGANGVVLKNGKYRCNICGSQMKNEKVLIRCHYSKLHPKDQNKSSAYLRQQAYRPTPCTRCDKICSSIEMLKKHIKQAHSHPTAPAPPEQDQVG